jgi:hypothetical protein
MKQYSYWVRACLMGAMVSALGAACGDSGEESGPESHVGEQSSALIEAKKGGDLAVGAVKIKVPADALEKDQELTVKVVDKKKHPESGKVALDVYEFGPKGTTFSKDVEIEFDLKGVKTGGNKKAYVAELDEETKEWKALGGSKVEKDKAHATIKHFSFYTVILEEASRPGSPEPIICDADFSPCGGSLEGEWEFTAGCASAYAQLGSPPPVAGGGCEEAPVYSVTLDVSGTVGFGPEAAYDLNQNLVLDSYYAITVACLEELSELSGTPLDCAEYIGGMVEDGLCTQSATSGDVPVISMGSYATEGGMLQLSSDSGYVMLGLVVDPLVDYCVEGDTLTLRVRDPQSEDNTQVYTARRL